MCFICILKMNIIHVVKDVEKGKIGGINLVSRDE